MKKFYLAALLGLFCMNTTYALQITSDENGPVSVSEPQLNVGDNAPKVTLTTHDYKKMTIGGATGKVQIISTIESLDTPVCDQQTMILNKAAEHLKNVQISVITANMPFVIDTYIAKHKINNINVLSTFEDDTFGKAYGVQVVGGELKGITARSVFVINKTGKVVYKEITSNIDHMPNMKAAIKAAEEANKA